MFFSRDNDTDSEYLGPPDGTLVCVCMANYDASNRSSLVCARSQNSSVSVRRVHVVSRVQDLRAEENRVLMQVEPPRCVETSTKPYARRRVRTRRLRLCCSPNQDHYDFAIVRTVRPRVLAGPHSASLDLWRAAFI